MKYTTNYTLKKPEGTDKVSIQDFNDNADTIDAKIKENADTIAAHTADTTKHITAAERVTWNGKQAALGYTPANRGGDAMAGILTAQANTSYTVRQVHNVILSTADADVNAMDNGDIWIKYV